MEQLYGRLERTARMVRIVRPLRAVRGTAAGPPVLVHGLPGPPLAVVLRLPGPPLAIARLSPGPLVVEVQTDRPVRRRFADETVRRETAQRRVKIPKAVTVSHRRATTTTAVIKV